MAMNSCLLSLPVELLHHLFLHLSTPSFLQLSLTNRLLFDAACSGRRALLHHLRHVPGYKIGLEDVPTQELFCILRRRAVRHLYGANLHADCLSYPCPIWPSVSPAEATESNGDGAGTFFANGRIDASASEFNPKCEPNLALVNIDHPVVRLYHVTRQGIERRELIALSPKSLGHLWDGPIKIIKVRLSHRQDCPTIVTLLYILTPTSTKAEIDMNQFERDAWQEVKDGISGVIHFELDFQAGIRGATLVPLERPPGYIPFTMALYEPTSGRLAVGWRRRTSNIDDELVGDPEQCSSQDIMIGLYRGLEYQPQVQISRPSQYECVEIVLASRALDPTVKNRVIREVSFARVFNSVHDPPALLLYTPGHFAHDLYVTEHKEAPPVNERVSLYLHGGSGSYFWRNGRLFYWHENRHIHSAPSMKIKIAAPFYGSHQVWPKVPTAEQESSCILKYLALGVTVHTCHDLTTDRQVEDLPPVGVITALVCKKRPEDCNHNPDVALAHPVGYGLRTVARLWGFRPPCSNMPGVSAISPKCTRIAIAHWNKILIWSLDPEKLLEDTGVDDHSEAVFLGSYKTEEAYFETAWLEDIEEEGPVAVLKPIVLNLDGGAVVRHIGFGGNPKKDLMATNPAQPGKAPLDRLESQDEDEDTVVVVTDRSVVVYHFGPGATSNRETRTWPDQDSLVSDSSFNVVKSLLFPPLSNSQKALGMVT